MNNDDHRRAFDAIEVSLATLDEIALLPPRITAKLPVQYLRPMGMHEHVEPYVIIDELGQERPL